MDAFKNLILHRLTLRILYIAAAFSTSHIVAFASSDEVQTVIQKAGISFRVVDAAALKAWITGLLLVSGEFVYHFFHEKALQHGVFETKNTEVIQK